ncbi:MAG: carboxypeptidase-like regulatory domain-containing protein, partial [Daejeonella sp.]
MKLKFLLPRLLFSLLLFFFVDFAQAQNITISGKVTDSKDQQPLIGVSVKVKGTPSGTSTGVDGTFRLSVASNASSLLFTYLGYNNQEVSINGRTTINIAMDPSATSLNEVVVVGYGTQKVKDATGSVASLG